MAFKSTLLKQRTELRFLLILLLITTIFCFAHCARQIAPSGGPPDKSPPRILQVTPEKNSTLVPLDQIVEFVFSESMDWKSLPRAIFITPDPGDRVKLKWKKRKLRIQFTDSLKTNRTYVITLGTDLKDFHGNALKTSFTLAFSTGAEISNGTIRGRVYSEEKAQGILIWAYILENEQNPDPTQRPGDYVTQSGGQGQYELSNLSEGVYRIFAIWDKDNNRFFDIGADGLGVPTRDIALTNEQLTVSNINFKLAVQDTLGPALVSVSAQDRHHLNLRFDEKLLKEGVEKIENYSIREKKSSSRDSLRIQLAYLNDRDAVEAKLITAPQKPQTEYEIEVNNLMDLSHNSVDLNFNRAEFIASALPDTIKPRIVTTTPNDSARAVFLNANIAFHFDEAMNQNSFQQNFHLQDAAGHMLPGTFLWETPAFVKFSPAKLMTSQTQYETTLQLDSVLDLLGNAIGDSTFR
ncbi:MAG: Ig-like domain-containing protein, partial [bacterium]